MARLPRMRGDRPVPPAAAQPLRLPRMRAGIDPTSLSASPCSRLPRMRGIDRCRRQQELPHWRLPRMGSTLMVAGRVCVDDGYPVCAGSTPCDDDDIPVSVGYPVCAGIDHFPFLLYSPFCRATPYARGSTLERARAACQCDGYPVCAGIDLIPLETRLLTAGLPRMRGDRPHD